MKHRSEILPVKVNWHHEIVLTFLGLSFTVLATVLLLQDVGGILEEKIGTGFVLPVFEQSLFLVIVCFLIYGNVIYQLSRLGFLIRDKRHAYKKDEDMFYLFDDKAPAITMLIPSYKEEVRIIHQTLLSSAMQMYPHKNVVLLIDDPSYPTCPDDVAALQAARDLPGEVAAFLDVPRQRYEEACRIFMAAVKQDSVDFKKETMKLAYLYDDAALYLEKYADSYEVHDHTDQFFVDKILGTPIKNYRVFSRFLKNRVGCCRVITRGNRAAGLL